MCCTHQIERKQETSPTNADFIVRFGGYTVDYQLTIFNVHFYYHLNQTEDIAYCAF